MRLKDRVALVTEAAPGITAPETVTHFWAWGLDTL